MRNAGEAETMEKAFMWREECFGWSMEALLSSQQSIIAYQLLRYLRL
jgi:hypothetical protein